MRNKIIYDNRTFTTGEIKSGSVKLHTVTSLLSTKLEPNTFTADVKCNDPTIKNFVRNTPLTYYHKDVQRMVAYIQSVTRIGAQRYRLYGTSAIGLLVDREHKGGLYEGETVEQVISDICGNIPFIVKDDIKDIALYGWLPYVKPPKTSARDNLRQVLFAIGATVKTDLDGILRIESLWNGISGYLGREKTYRGASVKYGSEVSRVVVTEHQYTLSNEETELFTGTSQDGDIITFSEPIHDLVASGFTIKESGANYAILSTGTGTLKGKKYTHNTRQIARNTNNAKSSETENVKSVTDATLVSLVNSSAVAERLANYYSCQETINGNVVLERQATGDIVTSYHPYDKQTVNACIESLDITASGILKASAKQLVGFSPLKSTEIVYYDEHVLLTGSGTWEVPEGVEEIRAVLIGAGQAGFDGESGESCPSSSGDYQNETNYRFTVSANNKTQTRSKSSNASALTAGKGGSGGQAGSPGKVFETTIKLNGEKEFLYSCGNAGLSNGEIGGDTTFGNNSSSEGNILQSGYTDLVDQTIYAVPGVSGTNGGDGGSTGNSGESIGNAKGGNGIDSYSTNKESSSTGSTVEPFGYRENSAEGSGTIGPAGGGGSGGSSSDIDGENGGDASFQNELITLDCSNGMSATLAIYPAKGGIGGKGANGKSAKTFGSSGDGGGGGGGAGATGSASGNLSHTSGYPSTPSSTDKTLQASMSTWCQSRGATSVSGGAGGSGGAGANGCIILYYGVPKEIKTGAIIGSDSKIRLDKYGRIMIG